MTTIHNLSWAFPSASDFSNTIVFSSSGHSTGRPDVPLTTEGTSYGSGLHSVLQDSVSPAFGATIIIIVTVIVSGSAYLCFLKYVCAGCCKPTQVAPVTNTNPNKSEEQV